ncbi:beta-lactamase family protein [Pontibacter burrus]|nr:beta-lactamase family protein [Pontibacter burrus]
MKKLFLALLMLLASNLTHAQNDTYKQAVAAFVENYNAGQYSKIFDAFSEEMQTFLPADRTVTVLSGLKTQFGNIAGTELIDFKNGNMASYKATFEKGVLQLNLSVNESTRIRGIEFKPYVAEQVNYDHVVNALSGINKQQADLIFEHVKTFPGNTQLAFAFVENGKPAYYGIIKENDTVKFTTNSQKVFEIGSITKVFTATLLADLIVQKKLKPEDEVNRYFSFPFNNNTRLSFESLANHTSGLPRMPANFEASVDNQANPYKNYDANNLHAYLKDELTLSNTGKKTYAYSNLGSGLLGYSLGLAQKSDYRDMLQKRVFKKYNMRNTFTDRTAAAGKLVTGLDKDGKPTSNWDMSVFAGAGAILSTTEDMATFMTAHFKPSDKVLALTRKPTFVVDEKMEVGLGWHIIKMKSGQSLHWHNGGTGGYTSSMILDASQQKGVVILSNVSAFHPDMQQIDNLCFGLINTLP